MTAQSLTGNFSKFGTYFLYKLRNMRSLIILNGIFALFSYPTALSLLVAFANVSEEMDAYRAMHDFMSYDYYDDPEYLRLEGLCDTLEGIAIAAVFIGVIMLVLMFVMNYIICAKSYRWLYDKTVVDMDYALPVSDDTRFFGDLLASFAGSLVPHLIAIIIGCVLFRFLPYADDEAEMVAMVCNIFDQHVFTGFVSCIMFTALSLFVLSLCGRTAEARIYPFVINAIVPIIHFVCMAIVLTNVYGYTSSGNASEYLSVAVSSPLGLLGVTLLYAMSGEYYYDEMEQSFAAPMFHVEVLIPMLIVTIGLFVASYFLIKYRRAERVGSPYVFDIVKVAIPAAVTFAITSCFSIFIFNAIKEMSDDSILYYSYNERPEGYIVAWLITTFVLFVIMELVSGKGFKKFYITLLKYVVITAASFGICAVLFYSNGMGIAGYTPDAGSVSKAQIWVWNNQNTNGNLIGSVTSEEEIQKIIDFHKDIPKDGPETDENTFQFVVDYSMKDGSVVSREYAITEERYKQAMDSLFSAELYYSNIVPVQFEWFRENTDDDKYIIYGVMTMDDDKYYEARIAPQELAEALRKDSELATIERVMNAGVYEHLEFRHNDVPAYSSSSYYTFHLSLLPWYENTIALLESKGVKGLFDGVDTSDYESAFIVKYDISESGIMNTEYTNPEMLFYLTGDFTVEDLEQYGYDVDLFFEKYGNMEVTDQEIVTELFGSGDYMTVRSLPVDSAEVKELIKVSSETYSGMYSSDVVYKLVMLDCSSFEELNYSSYDMVEFYISEEYLDDAAEIFNSLAA